MVIKKSVLLSIVALGILMQTPANAMKRSISQEALLSDRSRRNASVLPPETAAAPQSKIKQIKGWFFNGSHSTIGHFTQNTESQKILYTFKSPSILAQSAVICALLARAIQGKASAADYSKVAAYSFAGSMATSLLDKVSGKGLDKLRTAGWEKTEPKLEKLAYCAEFVIFAAGQNPDVVKSIAASIKARTVGKDLTTLILSLNKDVNRSQRLAALVRTFGPFLVDECLDKYKQQQLQQQLQQLQLQQLQQQLQQLQPARYY